MGIFGSKEFPGTGSFPHGIHPPGNKFYSAGAQVEVITVPDKVVLPLLQHIGAPCEPVVKPRQTVACGEMVGEGQAFVSASLHTPVAGKVKKIGVVTLPNGRHLPAIEIKTEGEQQPCNELWEEMTSTDWSLSTIPDYSPDEIARLIHAAGIVGLGGAAFPTHVKVMPNDKRLIDSLLVNGCECEPYLTCDYRLMKEAPHAIVAGALLAGRAVSAKEIFICIEDNKPEAIEALELATRNTVVQVAVVRTKYPQGSEKQLVKAVLNLDVPLGGLPSDVGVALSNVGTMAAVARAVIKKGPLTHRIVSVTGGGIVTPKNIFTPIGISMGELIDFCGGLTEDAARIIAGGPMMGFAFSDLTTPVTKGTSGITILTHAETASGEETACVRCGRCVEACPMNLVPTRLAMAARYKNTALARQYNINACFECGSCTYVCPANIKLVQLIRTGKAQVAAAMKR
ncbi:RnfC1 [Desulforapulum autotrophicum HRM2]|uniref:Ion-translocating oxidoreductase complex subunit C n=2 Tax=Desulforapulum autotrophicum TaxID=2296 RepID=C0QFQ4_DESAH|nr:RnfC1 [Desulforapulum autotrophicum HRM2]